MHTAQEIQEQYARLPALLLPWYAANARDLPWRRTREPYRIWVSEIMLQQTRVEAVRGYYERFLRTLPDIAALANTSEESLFKLWEGLGYYSRARNLQKAARIILEKHGGIFPNTYADVRALPGIGDYTAGAICSICFDMPRAAVDGNVLRILARINEDAEPIDLPQTKKRAAEQLEPVYPKGACGAFTQSLMELGACICTPRTPKCDDCPVKVYCFAHASETVSQFPVKLPKRKKREEQRTVFLLECDGTTALTKRGQKGLLSGLWQLPNVEGMLSPADALKVVSDFGVHPTELLEEVHKSHIFTHIRWDMVCYRIRCLVKDDAFTWATDAALHGQYALPTAFRIFLE